MKVYVLISAFAGPTVNVVLKVREIDLVQKCHQVTGPYNIIAEIEGDKEEVAQTVLKIRRLTGVYSTNTLAVLF